jgi:hypothetical protein
VLELKDWAAEVMFPDRATSVVELREATTQHSGREPTFGAQSEAGWFLQSPTPVFSA